MSEFGAEFSAASPLGRHSTRATKSGGPVAMNGDLYATVAHWLIEEAYMLDDQRYEEWLDTIASDVHYIMPVRVTTALGTGYTTSPGMAHWDENKYSLSRRVARFMTDHAWTEDPPSRLRHYITNIRVFHSDVPDEYVVDSAALLFRSRGDANEPSIVSAQREDVLRLVDGNLLLARRAILVDESVLRTQNLAVFL